MTYDFALGSMSRAGGGGARYLEPRNWLGNDWTIQHTWKPESRLIWPGLAESPHAAGQEAAGRAVAWGQGLGREALA